MNSLYRMLCLIMGLSCLIQSNISGQKVRIAELSDEGELFTYELESLPINNENNRSEYLQLEKFPFSSPAHPTFKNFRNVTISDINQDGTKEILVCLNETLFVIKSDGSLLWQFRLSGTSNMPPAVADIDNDGDLEIALQTYGVPSLGNVYLFDHEGNIEQGWPLNISNHLFLNAITLADLNGDGSLEIIASERISGASGNVHALRPNATSIEGWPVSIPGTPAFTPSVGDLDNDGTLEVVTSTTSALYVFDATGNLRSGFPQAEFGSKFSYQSPILADLDDNETLEIIGTRHGDLPGTYVFDNEGQYFGEWPEFDNIWNYAPPTVADIDGDNDLEVFFARPYVSSNTKGAILLGYDHLGNDLDGFPIQGFAGSEGLVAIADIDNDGDYELITASKASIDGRGFIHAYHAESGTEAENFPIEVEGFTFLNGAFLSDIDNDGLLDLTALSYQLKFEQSTDTAFINVFNLDVPYNEGTILFNGYKGSNAHTGLVSSTLTSIQEEIGKNTLTLSPNPVIDRLLVGNLDLPGAAPFLIFDVNGRVVMNGYFEGQQINVANLISGIYSILVTSDGHPFTSTFVKQ